MQLYQSDYQPTFLRIYDGNSTQSGRLLAEIKGGQIPGNVTSCREMHVEFSSLTTSYYWYSSSGYYAKIHVTKAPNHTKLEEVGHCTSTCRCGANEGPCTSNDQCYLNHICIVGSCPSSLGFSNETSCCQDVSCGFADVKSGMVFSPNYPNHYGRSLQCSQGITVEPGQMITIEFHSFDVRNSL